MYKKNNHFTPKRVSTLSLCEKFVFGSNLEGRHMGGAAKLAHEKFGAEWGVGDGPTGQYYAIPTMHGGLDAIRPYVDKFIAYAKAHPQNRFLLTRIGCGIAGFKDIDMTQLFKEVIGMPNISIPEEWLAGLLIDTTLGFDIPKEREMAPKVITELNLHQLCQKHIYEIGASIPGLLPRITVRYVAENKKFGYVDFGDFFFYNDDLYVWSLNDKWADQHNQGVVLDVFHDECERRGYARKVLFAGVRTTTKDSNGEWIYTGDVINIMERDVDSQGTQIALASFDSAEETDYRFILDNHSLPLSNCKRQKMKLQRIGTVLFQLDGDQDPPKSLTIRTMDFNGWHDTNEEHQLKVLMAKYTPNFDQEEWKYTALELLGAEFNWR